jgi:hypothetical protein
MYGQLKFRHQGFKLPNHYIVQVGHLNARLLNEYLEFLELVYGKRNVRFVDHNDECLVTLRLQGKMSDIGLRFVSSLYQVPVSTATGT